MRLLARGIQVWAGRMLLDLPLALIIWAACVYGFQDGPAGTLGGRHAFLQTMIGICMAGVAFAVTAASVLFAVTPGPRLRSVMDKAGYQLARLIMGSVLGLILVSSTLAFLLLVDSADPHVLVFPMAIAASSLGLLASLRLAWLFSQIFALLTLEK